MSGRQRDALTEDDVRDTGVDKLGGAGGDDGFVWEEVMRREGAERT